MSKILICDDDVEIGKILAEWLETLGQNVKVISQPQMVLPLLLRERFDILLLDYRMPGLSGKDLLTEVRKVFGPAELVVGFLTAYGEKELVVELAKLGIAAFFVKPLNFDVISKKIPFMAPRRLKVADIRNMMEHCHLSDKTIANFPGLSGSIANKTHSWFRARAFGDTEIVLGTNGLTSLATHQQLTDQMIMEMVAAYIQVNGMWLKCWPTYWDSNSI
ncbi:MAG: response regulator [Proteobacteria bacterium]|nr:response regulator [Pseudomonadota bacterium]